MVSRLFWLFWHTSEIFLCCLYMTNNDMITIHFLKGNIIEIMGKIIFHISMKFWVTLTHIFQGQFFFLPKKINFRGLCTKLCNDICTDNTSDSCRKHLAFRKCILLALFSNYYKAGEVDFFTPKNAVFHQCTKNGTFHYYLVRLVIVCENYGNDLQIIILLFLRCFKKGSFLEIHLIIIWSLWN